MRSAPGHFTPAFGARRPDMKCRLHRHAKRPLQADYNAFSDRRAAT